MEMISRENCIVRLLFKIWFWEGSPSTALFWWWWNSADDSGLWSQGSALHQSSLSYSDPLCKRYISIVCFRGLTPDKQAPRVTMKHSSSQAHHSVLCCAGLEIELLYGVLRGSLEIAIPDDWTNKESKENFLIECQGLCWGFSPPMLSTLWCCKASKLAVRD